MSEDKGRLWRPKVDIKRNEAEHSLELTFAFPDLLIKDDEEFEECVKQAQHVVQHMMRVASGRI